MNDYKCTKIEYDTGNPIYKGQHWKLEPNDDDPYWTIYKYTYTGSDITKIQRAEGTWTGRAALFA